MKEYRKEIVVSLILVGIVASSMMYFFKYIKDGKTPVDIDLFRLLPIESESILCINQPGLFNDLLNAPLGDTLLSVIKSENLLSNDLISLIKQLPVNQHYIIAFNKQGTIFYTTDTKHNLIKIRQTIFARTSPYPAREELLAGTIKAQFYALSKNKFFGYYEYKGVLVAAYSRKLLEKAAVRQTASEDPRVITPPWFQASRKLNRQVPINILFPTDSLRLSLTIDSIAKPIHNRWLAADIYFEKNKLCCFGNTTGSELADSLYIQLSDTISARVKEIWPSIHATASLEKEGGSLYYTVCGSLPVSTVSPSYE